MRNNLKYVHIALYCTTMMQGRALKVNFNNDNLSLSGLHGSEVELLCVMCVATKTPSRKHAFPWQCYYLEKALVMEDKGTDKETNNQITINTDNSVLR